jgi:tRNA G10  N-methylase Trm11
MEDTRFAWRSRDVPAASHPTIAAALARLSRPSSDDVVWDPFCGSGLELVERAKVARAVAVVGTDVSEDALSAARENVRASGVEGVILELGDSRTSTIPRGVTTVITNPPLGRRVLRGEHADVVSHVLRRVGEALPNGGTLVWVSPSRGFDKVAEGAGLVLERGLDVDLGGFMGRIEVRRKDASVGRTEHEHRGGVRSKAQGDDDSDEDDGSDDFEIVVSSPSGPAAPRGKRK